MKRLKHLAEVLIHTKLKQFYLKRIKTIKIQLATRDCTALSPSIKFMFLLFSFVITLFINYYLPMSRIYSNSMHLPLTLRNVTYILTVTSMLCSGMCEDIFIFLVFCWV